MTIWSAGGDTFVMANYLPVCFDLAVRISLTSLSKKLVTSWGDLNRKLIESFQSNCNRPGNQFDLTWIKQKSDESLRAYIKRSVPRRPRSLMSQITRSLQPSKEAYRAMTWSRTSWSPPGWTRKGRMTTWSLWWTDSRRTLG
ncbi:hypothetical protein PR202_gb20152 [Eleusine coracana subsp. coracana]|uniref:Uncharacterized protein n=1 Tax=Eleusine coracana subsp. coracana TaxID=191504 RepID=A0AAV5FAL5_ELECO|nr:hypothetical protein PR202_gb20152 [Eleusine coracana subsp. coracana]